MSTKSEAEILTKLLSKLFPQQSLDDAAHEAGRLVVGAVQGFYVAADFFERDAPDPGRCGTTCFMFGHDSAEVRVAGIVGLLLSIEPDATISRVQSLINEHLEKYRASSTDQETIPTNKKERDAAVAVACKILCGNWLFFVWARIKLCSAGQITDGEVEDYCEEHRVRRVPHPSATKSIEIRKGLERKRAEMAKLRMKSTVKGQK
jgi:hypothetical protein